MLYLVWLFLVCLMMFVFHIFICIVLQWGWLVSALEWCVFVCNHNTRGDHWKDSFTTSPRFIQAIMANGSHSVPVNKLVFMYCALHGLMWTLCVRVSDASRHMGGEWAALPPTVAVRVSVRFIDPLAVPALLDPDSGDPAAGCRAPACSFSRGKNNLWLSSCWQKSQLYSNNCCSYF